MSTEAENQRPATAEFLATLLKATVRFLASDLNAVIRTANTEMESMSGADSSRATACAQGECGSGCEVNADTQILLHLVKSARASVTAPDPSRHQMIPWLGDVCFGDMQSLARRGNSGLQPYLALDLLPILDWQECGGLARWSLKGVLTRRAGARRCGARGTRRAAHAAPSPHGGSGCLNRSSIS